MDVYGFKVHIRDRRGAVSKLLGLDFAWFASASNDEPDLEIVIDDKAPDIGRFAGARAASIGPRGVLYRHNGSLITDMGGRALLEYEPEHSRVVITYRDEAAAHEALYTFLNKQITKHLDKVGFVRLHALALVGQGGGATALMLPSGGGKTTMALHALETDGIKLLSDDGPLVDRRGMIHPFPLRMGLTASDASAETQRRLRPIESTEARRKLAIEVDTFEDRIADRPEPLRHIVIGRRVVSDQASLHEVRRRVALGPLIREAIVPPTLYEGLRVLQETGRKETVQKIRGRAGRAICCASFLKRARVWTLDMGTDPARNWAALSSLVDEHR